MLGETKARELCHNVLQRIQKDDAAEVLVFVEDSALTRFANNTIHQNVYETNVNVVVRYLIGQQIGTASGNRTDEAGLAELVARARLNASASPADPDYPGLPGPASYTPIPAFDEDTAEMEPDVRARAVGVVCKQAAEKSLNASGAYATGYGELAIANSKGLFAYHATTSADFQTTVMSDDSSGRAHASGWRASTLPVESLGREAIFKAESGRAPQAIEPGEYVVILDPYATEDVVSMLNFYGMGAQAVLEGRSWMNDRIGQKVLDAKISIWDDGLDLNGVPQPFDFEGVPKQRVDIVKDGVVVGPVYDRYVGQKMNHPSTGHAMPPTFRGMGPVATNLFMAGGDASIEKMIATTEKGLYITRFWYTRLVHPRDCVITGMTRDGVFLIENGQITRPVKNLRFTQSYVDALSNVLAVGQQTHLFTGEFGGLATRVPALKLAKFNFTGSTV
jgi:predicted Zn-dependent protease